MKFNRIPRYTIVGAFCAAIYNAIMIAGDALGVHYAVSTGIAFVIIVITGYALYCLYTFSEKLSVRGFARYSGAMLLTLPISLGGMWLLRGLAHAPMWFASPFLTAVMFCLNFVAAHWAVVTQALGRKKGALGKGAADGAAG
jgi:putative flippase GtrA